MIERLLGGRMSEIGSVRDMDFLSLACCLEVEGI